MPDLKKKQSFKRTDNKGYIMKLVNERFIKKPRTVHMPQLEEKQGEY